MGHACACMRLSKTRLDLSCFQKTVNLHVQGKIFFFFVDGFTIFVFSSEANAGQKHLQTGPTKRPTCGPTNRRQNNTSTFIVYRHIKSVFKRELSQYYHISLGVTGIKHEESQGLIRAQKKTKKNQKKKPKKESRRNGKEGERLILCQLNPGKSAE